MDETPRGVSNTELQNEGRQERQQEEVMQVFISSGQYLVLNEDRTFIGTIFSNLKQAVAYCRSHGKPPIFTWEV